MTAQRAIEQVKAEIEAKRPQMYAAAAEFGFTDPRTVAISQEIDELHNEYMRLERAANQTRGENIA